MNINMEELFKKIREMKDLSFSDHHLILETLIFAYIDARTQAKEKLNKEDFFSIFRSGPNKLIGELIGSLDWPISLREGLKKFKTDVLKEKKEAAQKVITEIQENSSCKK